MVARRCCRQGRLALHRLIAGRTACIPLGDRDAVCIHLVLLLLKAERFKGREAGASGVDCAEWKQRAENRRIGVARK